MGGLHRAWRRGQRAKGKGYNQKSAVRYQRSEVGFKDLTLNTMPYAPCPMPVTQDAMRHALCPLPIRQDLQNYQDVNSIFNPRMGLKMGSFAMRKGSGMGKTVKVSDTATVDFKQVEYPPDDVL